MYFCWLFAVLYVGTLMLSPRKAVLTPYALRHMTSSIVYKDSQRRLSRGNYIPIRVCSYMSWASTSCTASRENSPEWDQFNSVIPLLWGCAVPRHWGKRVSLKPEFFTQTRIKISHSYRAFCVWLWPFRLSVNWFSCIPLCKCSNKMSINSLTCRWEATCEAITLTCRQNTEV